jgi:DNA-binding transcriptional LysR family regulator
MDHHDQIVAEIRNLKIESASRVSLALPDGYADMFPEGFFRDFLLRHPAKSLDIMSFPPDYLQESATKRAIALGFCNSPVNTTFFEILHTWKHRLIIVAGERHPLANRSSIKLKELQGETLILLNNQRHPQPVLMDLCNRAGITRYAYLGVSDSRLYRELCSTNRFVSFWAGPVNVPGLIGIEVDELKDICTEANFIRNKNVWLGDAAAAFIAWTEERFP